MNNLQNLEDSDILIGAFALPVGQRPGLQVVLQSDLVSIR